MFEAIDSASERIYVIKCSNIGSDLRMFEESVEEFIRSDSRHVVIDLKEQEAVSSLLLAALIRIRRELSLSHRELLIKNCNSHMYRCIELAGLESFFSFCNHTL
ncbi:MAG TPA: STAS domain-containing protein [Spirochaetota bacterium]|jgi:anti-anti-sigma regulatory factor|nr:STAS domain-containing protein [Spirochaetota bacterium]HPS87364.1 STAS domain-containing protein [Spirochaetota bacterium]